ncbi:GTPase HflX [bacterium (Candidatus Blackallbacteria) CG17_big_fil_post_rev_8_21_14_2_50_48_46]|uniref:GTPase HflX n=1 Tax=bacterium (Candidatus Blackallbacteria) CG17_big_fil_post_rev_8_21_14_2_50_48_46 TaxID=2014261 RepID=A0A2M7GBJ0_9BACT|nr:MAG: GTPase HflX [bacterium (Candidatus Blackallbacteria) CG18_big_fil_WC_8_21_14_2_50_49_26]PIW19554.1 MAG: GTPase HflX [bacterium (Candidatus Blackallbacteria) CG17_big_fil_post_rev_8_21_14_2_50_48_46]PIW48843.1 MAG: GTPase HflX [bacterium (Candidatus Blackallbacteria) CG13_big_fil_rev_8_21_14_2_50_49_14]
MFDTQLPVEKAILVGVQLPDTPDWEVNYSLDELASLADTAGIRSLGRCSQNRHHPDPATYIGRGKVEEVQALVEAHQADVVIFDPELSPAQISNLEKRLNVRVMDRGDVILMIFAERAQTREAKLQVDLARMKYFLPRLKRQWTHLERQVGGVGVRAGMGEKQIEVDRRLIRKKIERYEADLKEIEKQRKLRKNKRRETFSLALIGYTNVGKSTLFNRLTQADVLVENRLFATLDSTVRKIEIGAHEFVLTDTVGFIRKLPHHLVASFRSTLEEACDADVLLHVVDVTSPVLGEQMAAVNEVLKQLEIEDKPIVYVLNKADLLPQNEELHVWKHIPPEAPCVSVSAHTGENMDLLKELILETFSEQFREAIFVLPLSQSGFVAQLYTIATILEEEYLEGNRVKLRCRAPAKDLERFRKSWKAVADAGEEQLLSS